MLFSGLPRFKTFVFIGLFLIPRFELLFSLALLLSFQLLAHARPCRILVNLLCFFFFFLMLFGCVHFKSLWDSVFSKALLVVYLESLLPALLCYQHSISGIRTVCLWLGLFESLVRFLSIFISLSIWSYINHTFVSSLIFTHVSTDMNYLPSKIRKLLFFQRIHMIHGNFLIVSFGTHPF